MTRLRRWPPPPPEAESAIPIPSGKMVILGVDPGSRATGYAFLALNGGTLSAPPRLIDCGIIRTDTSQGHPPRLREIFESLSTLIRLHRPGEAAVENVFHAANARSALLLGQARGAALVAISAQGIPVHEYMPLDVKKTVTGYGRADKQQVRRMVALLVKGGDILNDSALPFDASDAVAVALCHAARRRAAFLVAAAAPQARRKVP